MYYKKHTNFLLFFLLIACLPLANANNSIQPINYFSKTIQQLKVSMVSVAIMAVPEICGNGIDDDNDGLIDCEDPDCNPFSANAQAANYRTIAGGDWNSAATWQGGNIPDAGAMDAINVSIEHDIILQNNNLKLDNNAQLYVTNASLTLNNGKFTIENGDVFFSNADLTTPHNKIVELTTTQSSFIANGGSINIGKDFQNSFGVRRLENICLTVNGVFDNALGTDTLINVCANIGVSNGGSVLIYSSSSVYLENSEINMPNGNFTNASGATISGFGNRIWVQNGNLENNGTWLADLKTYCVSGSVSVASNYLPNSEDCSVIASYFNPCQCTCRGIEEVCGNGIDDDGDGLIDGGDPDCPADCSESILFVARDNAEILQVNLTTGISSVASTSPYTLGNLNAMAANPDAGIIYYGEGKNVYYWNPTTGVHGVLINLAGQVGLNETLTSGAGAYFNDYLYLGFEDDTDADFPTIYRIPLATDGLSTTAGVTNLNVPIPTNTSWGDMIISPENGSTIIYAGLGYNNTSNQSLYFKYVIETSTFTTIRTDMPNELQFGVDVNGNLWGGSLANGTIQQIDKITGNFFGSSINVGGNLWDLTGPINCPQLIEICGNGLDDDGDGRIDSDDDDCDCPMIATTDNLMQNGCEGDDFTFLVVTDASNLPFTQIEFYRFTTQQSNPYTSLDPKVWLDQFPNSTGMGSITTADFPTNGNASETYYVYACVKPAPTDPNDCAPLIEYVVTVEPCVKLEVNCEDGRTIETFFAGLYNAVPKTLNFTDTTNIDSILIEILYKNSNPGATITIQDNFGNNYTLNRQSLANNAFIYQTVVPTISSITYSNEAHENKAQSILAYAYKSNQAGGAYASYTQNIGGYNNTRTMIFPLPNRTENEDVKITLPVSELTYDNRVLTFNTTAGAYTGSITKTWGTNGNDFPNNCCIDLVEIEILDVPFTVDTILIEVVSPGGGTGQSYVLSGTVFLEIKCFDTEDCADGVDNDGDGDIDLLDIDCSGYCGSNGTFLSYGMHELNNITTGVGLYSEHLNLTFDFAGSAFLYWLSGDDFYLKGDLVAYQGGNYIGKYKLIYTATGATYSTLDGDNILGSTGGSGRLVSKEPALTQYDEILMDAQINASGWGIVVRRYGANDIRVEGDWGLNGWSGINAVNVAVIPDNCEEPREICGNGEDDDNDGLLDCEDPDCTNPPNAGTITGNESNCGLYNPSEITENNVPNNGGSGITEYQWEQSTDNNNWSNILGAIQATYDPEPISQTIHYRRKMRKGDCNPWLTSNQVNKIVTPTNYEAQIINAPSGANGYLCGSESYIYEAAVVANAFYVWNFGDYATPPSATGVGPHSIVFNTPTDSLAIISEVVLTVVVALCIDTDTTKFSLHPLAVVTTVNSGNPTACGVGDGWINVTAKGEKDLCVQVSLDGGINYQPDGQLSFSGLGSGSYEVVVRYCNNDCPNVFEIVNLSDPTSISLVDDDYADICPGFEYSSNVLFNDALQGETVLTLEENANHGTVALDPDGTFVYTPNTPTCDMDQFSYKICDTGFNCCAIAVVTIDFGDNEVPDLLNVPDDLTVNCDDEIPLPPLVSAFDNCPAISIDKQEKNTQGEDGCSLYDYTITYTWIAKDFCGNEARDSQLIDVKDITAPDIYRIYTLPNGKKMVAGVMGNVTHRWKVIQLPIEFNSVPVIFSQLVTTNEVTPDIVRLRNTSTTQFEMKLQEEDANDGNRTGENVAWFAIEEGVQLTDYQLEVAVAQVGDETENINFQNAFSKTPAFFSNMQTILDKDPAYSRYDGLSVNGVTVKVEEETSVDTNILHTKEKLGYLAIDTTILTNDKGDIFGEVGQIFIDENWTTINLANEYVNPVIIANNLSQNESDPGFVQVNNVTTTSFDIKVKEWDYLDDNHAHETVSYIVIEGSVPLNGDKLCEDGTDNLVIGVDLVAVDNCDPNVVLSYDETESFSGPQRIITRIWSAIDECGNETIYARNVTCEGVLLQLRAILQGARIFSQDSLMRDDLRRKGLIPLVEPYSDNPNFEHIGEGGGEEMDATMMDETGADACVDWVFIELCDANNVDSVIATCAGVVQRDGDVMSSIGDTLIRFENVPPGDYFVSLSHRNHLKTISLNPYTFTPSFVPMVDFTYEFTPVIGIEPNINLGDVNALWSGDLNGDNRVIYQGPKNDVFNMFFHIVLDSMNSSFLTNFISSDYTNDDFNMDGTVIFQGPNNDKSNLLFNTILRHPNNSENFSNYIISTTSASQYVSPTDSDSTPPAFDFDADGIKDELDPDDDNDGVADGSDSEVNDHSNDSDGDGINNYLEKDGNTDPLNPCDPYPTNCSGIDDDGDGYYRNYPTNHPQYDPEDRNACVPDGLNAACSCKDDDGDGFVFICHKSINGNGTEKTIMIPLSALPTHLEHGDICGPCNE